MRIEHGVISPQALADSRIDEQAPRCHVSELDDELEATRQIASILTARSVEARGRILRHLYDRWQTADVPCAQRHVANGAGSASQDLDVDPDPDPDPGLVAGADHSLASPI
ncbi:hypothetical protein OHA25_60720 (plasmid) [Nonomuraea sp. NBC_00507]|uniref:hypothetical protein n=1 Tax=Nonomuraea sp. NBC_00507 TaxID=2976002 RepID=UPI002E16DEEE